MDFIQTREGILNQIKQDYYYTGILTKEGVYNYLIDCFEEYKKRLENPVYFIEKYCLINNNLLN